jgi:aminobenzoyl-glutamate utilization protein B
MSEDLDKGLRDGLAETGISRRGLMKLAGAATAASASLGVSAKAFAQEKDAAGEKAAEEAGTYERRQGRAKDSNAKATAVSWLDNNQAKVTDLNDEVFDAAELSLREWRSALAHANLLRRQGFSIEWGTAGLPAAFIATYTNGRGGPAIGFNAEYDALPGISQKAGVGIHDPAVYDYDPYAPEYGAGHGCGHCALGAASTGAAIATAQALRKHGVPGTVRLYGSTGEEQLVGKVYAARAGAYKDLDAFIDWHPSPANATGWGSSSAMCSMTFTFLGQTSHGGAPTPARSSVTAIQMMVSMLEFIREKDVPSSAKMHFAIPNAGRAPNVITDIATIWVYAREGTPERATFLMDKVRKCAQAAADASRTELRTRYVTGCWNTLGNKAGAELGYENMLAIGPPKYSKASQDLAKQIQGSLGLPQNGMSETIPALAPPAPFPEGGTSTDMGDVSWLVPRVSFSAAVWVAGAPPHNWANASTAGSEPGHTGLMAAAKYMAATAVDLITQKDVLTEVKAEFAERTKTRRWSTMLPAGTEPPIYQPPPDFLRKTAEEWPPRGITWPVAPLIARMPLNDPGPPRIPVT